MELTPKQQTVELIRKSSRILLISRPSGDGDAIGSLVGLGLALEKIGKEVAMLSPDQVPASLHFLPSIARVTQQFAGARDLTVSIDLKQASVEKVSYRKNPNQGTLDILVTPKSGTIPPSAVSVGQSPFRFDLVIILDTPDLEELASVYDAHTQLFFEAPVVNIDHHAGNDYFGKVNWVELTATSTAEILVSLIESLGGAQPLWDADVATALLTGLLFDTQSFQSESTTPKSLTVAAQLIAQGGRQQEIVRSLFKTRPLSTLKLWGTILSDLKIDEEYRFVWAEVRRAVLERTGAVSADAGALLDELVKNAPGQDLAIIFVEEGAEKTTILLHSLVKHLNVADLARRLGGGGSPQRALFTLVQSLPSARDQVLDEVRTFQREQTPA